MGPWLRHQRAASVQTQQQLTSQTECLRGMCSAPLIYMFDPNLSQMCKLFFLPNREFQHWALCALSVLSCGKNKSPSSWALELDWCAGVSLGCWVSPLEACIMAFLSCPCLCSHASSRSSASGWPLLFVWQQRWECNKASQVLYGSPPAPPPLLVPLLPAFLAPGTYNTCGCTNTFWWVMALELCLPYSGCWDVLSPFPFLTVWY